MRTSRFAPALAALALAALPVLPAAAHHGWAWAEEAQTEMTGTIRTISFAPPHPSMTVDVDGTVWQVDLGNPSQTQRSGFAPGSAGEGHAVVILGNRSLNADEKRIKAVRITVGGQQFNMYPERIRE
ncbi:DUF6152 family protein [Hyphomonas sp.]|uniref:DUF6152 family protein n=1 Tax=Hyphomonas sp. TaxID=87 RepID=UPI00391B02FA